MIAKLVQLYRDGIITCYQVMMDCLHMVDPENPVVVLQNLPAEVQDEMLDYASRYDPRKSAPKERIMPTFDQVEAASKWIRQMRHDRNGHEETPLANPTSHRSN